MNEHFKDARYHLRWAARHTYQGIAEETAPLYHRLNRHTKEETPATRTEKVKTTVAQRTRQVGASIPQLR